MNGKRLKIYKDGVLIHEAKECSIPFEESKSFVNNEVVQEWNEPQITYITSETHYAPIDLSHWSKEDWETFKALIIKYDTKESL